ncbi:unnamed protein product [Dovyalis caffra]|uniref:Uncharacterized protein n=1 Tax=Dovyalis caffra TaxID=77055 RepID=A0AAV1QZ32_9ROSI|nr:unnamed protein product [Dovyalis caffra]
MATPHVICKLQLWREAGIMPTGIVLYIPFGYVQLKSATWARRIPRCMPAVRYMMLQNPRIAWDNYIKK